MSAAYNLGDLFDPSNTGDRVALIDCRDWDAPRSYTYKRVDALAKRSLPDGNAILVLDMRGSSARPTAEDARAIHRAPGLSYDQMMVLRDPNTPATEGHLLNWSALDADSVGVEINPATDPFWGYEGLAAVRQLCTAASMASRNASRLLSS
jgi:hypothetical protein